MITTLSTHENQKSQSLKSKKVRFLLKISCKYPLGALSYEAPQRLSELANPIGFSKDFEMPNLEFWQVKRSALRATASDRFNELAKHVTRQSMGPG